MWGHPTPHFLAKYLALHLYNGGEWGIPQDEPMNTQTTGLDMELSSGIAAFEAKHFAQAIQLLSPLAEQGQPEAQYRLAIMAQNGLGLHKNPLLAFKNMQAAAESGNALAQHGLGFMYLEGDCTTQDVAKAKHWFKQAAAQGLAGSQAMLESI